jgi:DNA-binding CsgD family transcriptional regulator
MQLLSLMPATPKSVPDGTAADALLGVIASIGDVSFGSCALEQLNRWMPLCWLSIYRLYDDAPPTTHALASFRFEDGTRDSWRVYRAGLYRRDETFAAARERVRDGEAVLTHWQAAEIRGSHRQQIYSRHHLRERVSLVTSTGKDGLLALNLYRHHGQPALSDDAIDGLRLLGPPLLACVTRHLALAEAANAGPVADTVLMSLTGREREVCERILKGWTHDGIAADLHLSAATVKTYRDRAFERLGIHHRGELFALLTQPGARHSAER